MLDDLSEFHKDMVKEGIGIAITHAATALSKLFNDVVDLEVPKMEIINKEEFLSCMYNLDDRFTVGFDILEGISGIAILQFSKESTLTLSALLMGLSPGDVTELDELGESAIMEVGNIMVSVHTDILSILLKESVSLSPPRHYKNIDELLNDINRPELKETNRIILFKTRFYNENYGIETFFYLIPSVGSIEKLIKSLEEELERYGYGN